MANTEALASGMFIAPARRVHFRNPAGLQPIFKSDPGLPVPDSMFMEGDFGERLADDFKVRPPQNSDMAHVGHSPVSAGYGLNSALFLMNIYLRTRLKC